MPESSIARLMTSFQKTLNPLIEKIEALPALKAGLPLFLGPLFFENPYLCCFFLIILLLITKQPKFTLIYFFISVLFLYGHQQNISPKMPIETLGYLEVSESKKNRHSFQIVGEIKGLIDENKVEHLSQKISFFYPKPIEPGCYICKALFLFSESKRVIIKNPQIVSLEKKGSKWKVFRKNLRDQIKKRLLQNSTSSDGENLLLGLLMGFEVKKETKGLFLKLGLSHILAISGFHFSLIAANFSSLFRQFFRPKIQLFLLVGLLTFYFFLLDQSASIIRAYFTMMMGLIATLSDRKSLGLNLLFASGILSFLIQPMIVKSLAFLLSYLATLGILTLNPFFLFYLNKLMPKRPYASALLMSPVEKVGYLFLQFFKSTLSLNLSALTLTLPILFFYFGSVPVLSFYYNLYIPLLIGLVMTLGLVGIFFKGFFLFSYFYDLSCFFLDQIIQHLTFYPRNFDFQLLSVIKKPYQVLLVTFLLILFSLYQNGRKDEADCLKSTNFLT